MDRFLRTRSLIGEEGLQALKNSTVAVFGIGGVGSYALEALVRSGIGTVYIYDNDTVAKSNINRQLIALDSTVGAYKTSVAAARCRDINPEAKIFENPVFITPDTDIPFKSFDFIIDAIDNVTAKIHLAKNAEMLGIPIISVMGTGNKLYPERLKISDIFDTHECPLCRAMRTSLKKHGVSKLTVVWSDERPIKPEESGELRKTGRPAPASMTFVPASAGLLAASYVIRNLSQSI